MRYAPEGERYAASVAIRQPYSSFSGVGLLVGRGGGRRDVRARYANVGVLPGSLNDKKPIPRRNQLGGLDAGRVSSIVFLPVSGLVQSFA
jgi:hypothetical protein